MVRRLVWDILIVLGLVGGMANEIHGQAQGATVAQDSVSLRFVEVDLRSIVQALGRYLDQPIVITGLPGTRVTLETPYPVPRSQVLALLRGLLESQNLELATDSAASIYRVRPRQSERTTQPLALAPSPGGQPGMTQLYVARLKHARAADVAATVNALYGRASALGELGVRSSTLTGELQGNRVAPEQPAESRTAQGAVSLAGLSATLAGEVSIVPDAGTNSLMIRASQRDYELIIAAVRELDVRPLQVLIEVLIAEVRKDRGFSFGVDAALPPTHVPGSENTTVEATTSGIALGDFAIGVMGLGGSDVRATLRAAAARGDVAILSRPILLAANNELAQILVGSQRPFVQVSRSLPTDSPQRDQVVQYKDVGTKLNVRPTISPDGYVMLEVTQEVNAVTTETAFDAPVISTRSVETRLLVRDGQTAVLGGLSDRQRDKNQSGIPLLSAIPLLGGLFGRTVSRASETELFVFLTPTVIYTDDDMQKATSPREERADRAKP